MRDWKERNRKPLSRDLSFTVLLPKCLQQLASLCQAKVRNQKPHLDLPLRGQRSKYLSHHPKVCISRKLYCKAETRLDPRHSDMGYGHLNQQLNSLCHISHPMTCII